MGKAVSLAILAAALALMAPFSAHAAGLGRLNVLSPLGQPLNAEIEIVALRPGEEETLVARIAPLDAFTAAGIEPTAMLNTMRFALERRGGQRILKVTTTAPVNDPFVEILIELQWGSGRLVREYTFLLDPPEYKARDQIAAAPPAPKPAAPAPEAAKPPPPVEAKPIEPMAPAAPVIAPAPSAPAEAAKSRRLRPPSRPKNRPRNPPQNPRRSRKDPATEPVKEAAKPAAEPTTQHEVKKGDTVGAIARANLPPGITLNQMLIAIYRANQDAFIRENVNLVRAGRILNIPSAQELGSVDADEANRLVRAHMAEFREYRSRLAAVPAAAETVPGQREGEGRIEPKPEAPKPAAPADQVRLSKADPQKPGAASQAARGDDAAARERALKEAQSRIGDLEKNVSDLQKLLELKNQQLAELEKKAGAKPAPAPAPVAPAAKAPEKPAATPCTCTAGTGGPDAARASRESAGSAETGGCEARSAEARGGEARRAGSRPRRPPPSRRRSRPAPEPSLLDEFLDNPVALAGLGAVALLLLVYALWAWRKKKTAQARFQDSVIGAAAAGAAAGSTLAEPTFAPTTGGSAATPASAAPAGAAAEEVDPIAEADVYMAYGRDAQAEEILKEALQKDSSRIPVHAKLLEIYANRKDAKSFEQTARQAQRSHQQHRPGMGQGRGARPLDRSGQRPVRGFRRLGPALAAAAAPAAAAAAPAPTLDFDIGGAAQGPASAPDLTLDAGPKPGDAGLDFDRAAVPRRRRALTPTRRWTCAPPRIRARAASTSTSISARLRPTLRLRRASAPAADDPGLTFDLNLDLGGNQAEAPPSAPPPAADLSSISLDLGGAADAPAAAGGTDPKWQEIATKLDLAKAYEEMGDKDGARELLNEVMKDGDAAQKGTAQQLLAKLG